MTTLVLGLVSAVVLVALTLLVALLALRPSGESLSDVARIFPDCIRLTAALYRDPALPRSAKWKLRIALIYNLQPINIIPDFIPIIGFADNALILIWAIRGTIKAGDPELIRRSWTGSDPGLVLLTRALGLPPYD